MRGRLHHVIRHDVNVNVDDRLQGSPPFAKALRLYSLELVKAYVFEVQRLIVNPARRRSNPIRKLAQLHHAPRSSATGRTH